MISFLCGCQGLWRRLTSSSSFALLPLKNNPLPHLTTSFPQKTSCSSPLTPLYPPSHPKLPFNPSPRGAQRNEENKEEDRQYNRRRDRQLERQTRVADTMQLCSYFTMGRSCCTWIQQRWYYVALIPLPPSFPKYVRCALRGENKPKKLQIFSC